MADTIDIDEFSTQPLEAIAKHLRKGSFCEIYERSNEKDTLGALKFMCIVDYSLQRWDNLYRRIEEVANPKLLTQLMQFHTYGSFKYYFYRVDDGIGKRVLQCKSCELIGPYALILSHMAIVHNQHVGLRKCAYCDRIDFKDHIEDDTLQQCYRNYLQRYGIAWDEKICGIMNDIHDLLKGMADKFKVTTRRDCAFRGIGYKTDEWLADGYDSELDENIQVFANRTPQIKAKNMSGRSRVLNNEFKRIIGKLYGGNNTVSRTPRQQSAATNLNGNDTIDDYDNGLLASDAAYDDHNSHSDSTQSQASSVNDNPNSASSNANGNDTMDDYDAANDDHYTSNDSTQSQSSSHNDNQRSVSFAPMAIARGDDENDNGPIQSGPSTVNVSSTPVSYTQISFGISFLGSLSHCSVFEFLNF